MVRPSVFISYKRDHEPSTKAVAEAEKILGQLEIDPLRDNKIEAGDLWSNDLYNWLMQCSAAIAFIGEEPAKSEWCRREWWFLRERHRTTGLPVIPISVDGTHDSAGILNDIQTALIAGKLTKVTFKDIKALDNLRPSPESYLAAHHAWLRWQYQGARMWGREPFSLADVYVETECGMLNWGEINDDAEPRDPFIDSDDCGGRQDLVGTVMDLISDKSFREPIVIQGPPGCGKSAFTYRIANELLDKGLKPIHVRFRDFLLTLHDRADELIEDALIIGPKEEQPPRPKDRIITADLLDQTLKIGDATSSKIVFILDGWDEVSLTGNTSYQAQLTSWLPKFREYMSERRGPPVRLILTGRPSAEVRDSGVLTKKTPILTIRHLQPGALQVFAGEISRRLDAADLKDEDRWHIDLERLKPLFKSYENWFENQIESEDSVQSMDVMGSPLLAFLAFRTLADWQEDDPATLVREPTKLYKVLIDTTIKHAGKASDEQLSDKFKHSGNRLRFLLHRVAGIISILGREGVSFTELNLRLGEDPEFESFYKDGGVERAVDQETRLNTLLELIVSFFFKGGNTELGCEFLHKSFREYLYAESIVAVLKDISKGKSGYLDAPKVEYWQDFAEGSPQHEASRKLSALLAPQWLTNDVRAHLFWLLEDETSNNHGQWIWIRDLILDIYIWWAEGVHLRPQPFNDRGVPSWSPLYADEMLRQALPYDRLVSTEPPRSAALDAHLGEALMQITAHIHSLLHDTPCREEAEKSLRNNYRTGTKLSRFAPGGSGHFATISARINAAGWRMNGTFANGARLSLISLGSESLRFGQFSGADLSEADLSRANLIEADLSGANLREADLSKADVIVANLIEADLSGANLSGAHLSGANLIEANLIEANLSGANLRGAHLREAHLSGANLSGAHLIEADLSGADCTRARIDSSRLQSADLSTVKGLLQEQVNSAIGNSETKLPPGLNHPDHWGDDDPQA